MRPLAVVLISLAGVGLAAACSDDGSEPVVQPASVAVTVEIRVNQTDDRTWESTRTGWWDGTTGRAVLTEGGEPVWHESDGFITRMGVLVPDLTTPWAQFDLATWATVGRDDPDYLELGALPEIWAVPTVGSLVAIRDLAATEPLGEGASTVTVDGLAFLQALDPFVAGRSLVDCAGTHDVTVEVDEGVVHTLTTSIDTGMFPRSVRVQFTSWQGELAEPPDDDDITRARRHRGDLSAPAPPPIDCDHEPRDPFSLDRSACPAPTNRPEGGLFPMIERHGEATPALGGRVWLSLARPLDLEVLRNRVAAHELRVTAIAVQAPTAEIGVMSIHGILVDGVPPNQDGLDALVSGENLRSAIVPGRAVISSIQVDGAWGDLARLASDCDIHHAGNGNGSPAQVDLIDD